MKRITATDLPAVLWVAALMLAMTACAPDPDDAGRAEEVPQTPVTFIEHADGLLWLGAPPAAHQLGAARLSVAARGIARVRATGCGAAAHGTAFAVAPRLLVGAAHVITGASKIEIHVARDDTAEPLRFAAEVVGFSPGSDLALLRTDAEVPPMGLDRARLGAVAAVLGYPTGSALQASPARVEHLVWASGLWGDGVRRKVYILAADVRAGQSGAPLVDRHGRVAGVAFAAASGRAEIAFALSRDELLSFLVSAGIDARIDHRGRTVVRASAERLRPVANGACEFR
ncbi:S1 family peptidase [Candidatus Poriferisodalis sp.]|uniref:S1 family peptidase n=1 Tax=Candidatus Poriferisodalis sp. TaxID=3101277 RepID=UPI003B01A7AD